MHRHESVREVESSYHRGSNSLRALGYCHTARFCQLGYFSVRSPWVSRALLEATLAELDRARTDKRIAEDRLYAAWKEGYQVPARSVVAPEPPKPIELLPEALRGYVENWESSQTRAELETEIRRLLELGWPEERILKLLTDRSPEVTIE